MTGNHRERERVTGRPRVLLAEDHPAMAAELSALLATEYDVVDVVHDGMALINASRTTRPDAIVADICMPGLSGLAATAALVAADADCRVVLVTVMADRDVISRARNSGALGYVLKCDAGEQLIAAVDAALKGVVFLSSSAQLVVEETQTPGGRREGGGNAG